MSELDAFEHGLEAPPGPQLTVYLEADGSAVTIGTSWWHTALCTGCGHTFRRGDRVTVDRATRTVRHLNPALRCAVSTPDGGAEASADEAEFSAGLHDAWPISGDLPVARVDDVPGLLAPPVHGFRRPACLFCAHTFRPGELVVVCPCTPLQPRCSSAVHRDPGQGLVCWESWHPDSKIKVCPVLLTRAAP
jgi:hypothetical protein